MSTQRTIKVLVVDDSATARAVITRALASDPLIEIAGACASPFEAAEALSQELPDVIVLDVEMPRMDGLEFLSKLMAQHPLPVVVCSGTVGTSADRTADALRRGALAVVAKPNLVDDAAAPSVLALRTAVRRAVRATRDSVSPKLNGPFKSSPNTLVVIGASTGGTEALARLLSALPADVPPIAVVQHMPSGYTQRFAARLDGLCRATVREVVDGDELRAGHIFIGAGGRHFSVERRAGVLRASARRGTTPALHCPSVDELFESASRVEGLEIVAVLLTGMGADGAEGMLTLRKRGALTIAQDEATCAVFGMPREAIERGAAQRVLPLGAIAGAIIARGARVARVL